MTIQEGSILNQGPGQLGGRQRLSPTQTRGTLLRLEATNKSEPTMVTLTIDYKIVREDAGLPVNSNHLLVAEISWGSIKGRNTALIDIKHGVRLSLEASIIAVNVFYLQANAAVPVGGPTVDVYASVGQGSIGNSAGPLVTLTGNSFTINAGAANIWPIPSYAYALEIESNADPTVAIPNGFLVTFISNPNPIATRIIGRFSGANTPVSIPNGAEAFHLLNGGPGNQIYTPIFHLDL